MMGLKFKDKFNSYDDFRKEFIKLIKLELHGPSKFDPDEIKNIKINRPPSNLYSIGLLFPQRTSHVDEIQEGEHESNNELINQEEDTDIDLTNNNETSPKENSDILVENFESDQIRDDLNLSNLSITSFNIIVFPVPGPPSIID